MERNPWKSTKLSPFDPRRALLTPLPAAAFNTALELARAHCTFTEEFLFHTLPFSFFLSLRTLSGSATSCWLQTFQHGRIMSVLCSIWGSLRTGRWKLAMCVCVCIRADRCTESLSSSPRGVLITSKHALKQQAGFMRADTRFSHSELDLPAWEESFLTLMIK